MFALFWIIFRKLQEKYLNYFQERLRQLNFVPVEEVGLYVCMVRGGMLTALALLYCEEIKICQCVFYSFSENLQTCVSLLKQLKSLSLHIVRGNVVWKMCSWKIAAVWNTELLPPPPPLSHPEIPKGFIWLHIRYKKCCFCIWCKWKRGYPLPFFFPFFKKGAFQRQ